MRLERAAECLVLAVMAVACGNDASSGLGPPGAGGYGGAAGGGGMGGSGEGGGPHVTSSPKLDVLFLVDNSFGMADKQDLLAATVPDLVNAITNPGGKIQDVHVGVITSSLGGHGSTNICNGSSLPLRAEEENDAAHLVGTRPRAASLGVPGGFASWTTGGSTTDLVTKVQGLVQAAGEFGCGFEATMESLYRFLADPAPPASVVVAPCADDASKQCATQTGVDAVVLSQRSAFLRPDSELALIVLSNENDCSIRESGRYYYAARSDMISPQGSSACATNPNAPCCYSCADPAPAGCTADPLCQNPPDPKTDALNLRCFEEKRRFGKDFLYPLERYVNAFTKGTLCTSRVDLDTAACPDADGTGGPDLVQNPLFSGGAGVLPRSASMVHVLSIVGIPWQTLEKPGSATLEYSTGGELAQSNIWATVYGDPKASPPVRATDPLMVESTEARSGVTPGTGESLAPPGAGYLANSVNGHEYANARQDDLQFACIFPLLTPRDCVAAENAPDPRPSCDCLPSYDSLAYQYAVCQAPDGSYDHTERFGKAYPGLRHIGLARALGASGALASICAKQVTDKTEADYGYRPAIRVLMKELGVTP